MMQNNRIKQASGFTLLEVMISMVILGGALLLLMQMGMVALDGNDWSRNTTVATQASQQKLEQIRATINDAKSGKDEVEGMVRSWAIKPAGKFLREVTVALEYQDVRGTVHHDSMTALIRSDSI